MGHKASKLGDSCESQVKPEYVPACTEVRADPDQERIYGIFSLETVRRTAAV